jgi:hypothetical protein
MIVSPIPGMTPARASEHTLQGLISNLNGYAEQWTSIVTAGTNVALTPAQVLAKNIVLTAGASGAFTITLPPTSKIIDLLGPTLPYDGSYWFPFYVRNQGVGQTGTLTAGDADTIIDPINNTLPDGHVTKWMVNVVAAADGKPTTPMTLNFHFVFTANVGGGGISGGDLPQITLWASPTTLYGDPNLEWLRPFQTILAQNANLEVSALTGFLSNVNADFTPPTPGANVAVTSTLKGAPIVPGSVTIFGDASGQIITDDGLGNLIGNIGSGGTNTINYVTGAVSFSFAGAEITGIESNHSIYGPPGTVRVDALAFPTGGLDTFFQFNKVNDQSDPAIALGLPGLNALQGVSLHIYNTGTDTTNNFDKLWISPVTNAQFVRQQLGTGANASSVTYGLLQDVEQSGSRVILQCNSALWVLDASIDGGALYPGTTALDLGKITKPVANIFSNANVDAATYSVASTPGADGSFTTADAKTVTVSKGIIVSIV